MLQGIKTFKNSLMAVFFLGLVAFNPGESGASGSSDAELAEFNKKVVSCYAQLAQRAYDNSHSPDSCLGGSIEEPVDPRNDMGRWDYVISTKPQWLQIWQRFNSNGTLKELAFSFRGSADVYDWVIADLQSQSYLPSRPEDNSISPLRSSPSLSIGTSSKFAKGFLDRVDDLAPYIDLYIKDLEEWQDQNSSRKIGVKVTGHSLGAGAATIAGLYIADRFHARNNSFVEVFAFNSPATVNAQMQEDYRKAAGSCTFNFHVFNNSHDVVSAVPFNLKQVVSDAPSSQLFTNTSCAYLQAFSSDTENFAGIHLPRKYNFLFPAASTDVATELFRTITKHDLGQWILGSTAVEETLASATDQVASKWLPRTPIGGEEVTVNERSSARNGSINANLYSNSHAKYLVAEQGGNDDVNANRASAGVWERFTLIPGNNYCVRHGSSIVVKTRRGNYLRAKTDGKLDARASSASQGEVVFSVINHTSRTGCIAYGDVISLRAHTGKYVVAESNGDANANRSQIGAWEKFTVLQY